MYIFIIRNLCMQCNKQIIHYSSRPRALITPPSIEDDVIYTKPSLWCLLH